MSEDLRLKAMDYALAARANAEQDIVELAERIYEFLIGPVIMMGGQLDQVITQVVPEGSPFFESLRSTPPPLPQDLGKADQTPVPKEAWFSLADPDAKTRLVRTHQEAG